MTEANTYQRTYSLSEIARKPDRPRTTFKDWADQFYEYLSTVGEGRTTRYKEDSIELFAMIGEMKNRNEPNEVIRQALRGVVKEITINENKGNGAQPFMAGIIESYNKLTAELRVITKRMEEMEERHLEEMRTELDISRQEALKQIEALQQELEETRKQVATSSEKVVSKIDHFIDETRADRIKREEKELNKSFWQRLFNK